MKFIVSLMCLGILSGATFGQNPVPFVNQSLVPTSVAPGSPAFTLTVNGTGFVSGAVVKWNGSPRTTTFVGGPQLTASMPSATERNNCGSSVASGGACTVTKATGHRSAGIRIDDNGGGSPQKVTATENCSSRLMTDSPELFRGSFLL